MVSSSSVMFGSLTTLSSGRSHSSNGSWGLLTASSRRNSSMSPLSRRPGGPRYEVDPTTCILTSLDELLCSVLRRCDGGADTRQTATGDEDIGLQIEQCHVRFGDVASFAVGRRDTVEIGLCGFVRAFGESGRGSCQRAPQGNTRRLRR